MAQTEQPRRLLKLNNSWLTELSWPWKSPPPPVLDCLKKKTKKKTWHCSIRTEGRSWDRQTQSNIEQSLLMRGCFISVLLVHVLFNSSSSLSFTFAFILNLPDLIWLLELQVLFARIRGTCSTSRTFICRRKNRIEAACRMVSKEFYCDRTKTDILLCVSDVAT